VLAARKSRWLGQQYADITKLREIAARYDRAAARAEQRASRINTRIEKLRHQATLLREKAQRVLANVPEFEQQIKQHERDIHSATGRGGGGPPTSDVTGLHYRIRKLQQKVVDRQQRARALELRAATKTQKTAELKVRVERYNETARLAEQEAATFRKRADRLQLVSEQEGSAARPAEPAGTTDAPENPPDAP
jgi:predicted  nucleic acid-binding Zn-ribbon protein